MNERQLEEYFFKLDAQAAERVRNEHHREVDEFLIREGFTAENQVETRAYADPSTIRLALTYGEGCFARRGYDHSEVVDGVTRYYKITSEAAPIPLTDEEYEEVYKRIHDKGTVFPEANPINADAGIPEPGLDERTPGVFLFETNSTEKRSSVSAGIYKFCAIAECVLGLICAVIFSGLAGRFSLAVFLSVCIVFGALSIPLFAVSEALNTLAEIAGNTAG